MRIMMKKQGEGLPLGPVYTSYEYIRTIVNPWQSASNDFFGSSVATDGVRVAVGAHGDMRISVYDIASGSTLNNIEGYGTQVDMTSSNILVSNSSKSIQSGWSEGEAALYDYDGVFIRKESGAEVLEGVGGGLSLDVTTGTYAVSRTKNGIIYERDIATGNIVQTYNNPTLDGTNSNDYFGDYGLMLHEDVLIAGARGEDYQGIDGCGALYIMDRATGNSIHEIANPNPVSAAQFGISVGASGKYIVAAAPYENVGGTAKGHVYIIDKDTGAILHSLPGEQNGEYRGVGLDASGRYAVIGSDSIYPAWVLDLTTGQKVFEIGTAEASPWYKFGSSVAMHNDIVVLGDHGQNGRIHIFRLLP